MASVLLQTWIEASIAGFGQSRAVGAPAASSKARGRGGLIAQLLDGRRRVRMLDTVHQLARERLAERMDDRATRRRHLALYLDVVARATGALPGPGRKDALTGLDMEAENIRAALAWALADEPVVALRLASRLERYWRIRRFPEEGIRWLGAALAAAGPESTPDDVARAELALSSMLGCAEDRAAARPAARRALTLFRRANDESGIAEALLALASYAMVDNDMQRGRRWGEAALRHAHRSDDEVLVAQVSARLAPMLPAGQRRPALEQAAAVLRQRGDLSEVAETYGNAAYSEIADGRFEHALGLLDEAQAAAETVEAGASAGGRAT